MFVFMVLLQSVFASEVVTIERSREVVPLTLSLNAATVRCLVGDYSSSSLKISVPELKGFVRFPQTTRGETAPCINAGSCTFARGPGAGPLDPSMVLDSSRPTEDVEVTVTLEEELTLDHENRRCDRALRENVSAPVRGLDFRHSDGAYLGELAYDVCLKMIGR